MTLRFEFTDAESNKIWEMTVTGKNVIVQFGRTLTDGRTQLKEYATSKEAKAAQQRSKQS